MPSIKPKLEALIYAAEEPISVDRLAALLKDELLALKTAPVAEAESPQPAPVIENATENAEAHLGAVESHAPGSPTHADFACGGVATGGDFPPGGVEASASPASGGFSPGQVEVPGPPAGGLSQDAVESKRAPDKSEKVELRALLKPILEELVAEYAGENHGIEIRQVAGGYRMSTKPEHHDVVRAFAKSLKPPIRLSLQALETLAVIAYKQPVTVPEISDIRGVDSSGVIATLMDRKLISTAGRKAVVGRPMLYKTTKEFLLRFGLKDLQELPSVEEFEKLISADQQQDLFGTSSTAIADATGVPEIPQEEGVEQMAEDKAAVPENMTEPTVSSDPQHDKTDEDAAGQVASESKGG